MNFRTQETGHLPRWAIVAWVAAIVLMLATVLLAREPRGIFVLQEPDRANVSDANLSKAEGLSIRVRWNSIHRSSGPLRWGFLDSQVARCKRFGKPYMIRVMCGKHSPAWISGQWFKNAPVPWNTSAQAALSQFVTMLGARYGADPDLVCVHLTSTCNYANAEMHLCPDIHKASGYSLEKLIDAWRFGIDDYGRAFPDCALALNVSIEPPSPRTVKGHLTDATVANCQRILGERATFQHNSLQADLPETARHHQLIANLAAEGWRVGFQMVCPSSNRDRFGGSLATAYAKGERAGAQYYEVYQSDL
jgi:hypothetical protein